MSVGRSIRHFLAEAKRRRLFKVAALYIVGAWVVIQVADLVFEAWGIRDVALRYLFIGAILGFPIALVFGWRYDITAQGIVRTAPIESDELEDLSLRRTDYAVLVALAFFAVTLVWVVANKTVRDQGYVDTGTGAVEVAANSIAVLPFRNLTDNTNADYLSDGLTYELASYVSRLPDFMVTANSSSFALKHREVDLNKVRELLRVRYVVEGALLGAGDDLRIDVQLVDTDDGFRIWQETLAVDARNIPAQQSELASRLVVEMQSTLGVAKAAVPRMRLSNVPGAYDAYLLGMHEYRVKTDKQKPGDWVDRAIDHFEKAVELDPEFALAYARLARVQLIFLWSLRADRYEESMETSRRLVERALILDPDLDAAYMALAQIYRNENEYDAREQALRRALELNPANAGALFELGDLLWRRHRLSEAKDFIRAAAMRDPLGMNTVLINADLDARLGNYSRANAQLLQLIENHPGEEPFGALAELERNFGHFDEAARWEYQAYRRGGGSLASPALNLAAYELAETWLPSEHVGPRDLHFPVMCVLLVATGRKDEAVQHIKDAVAAEVPPPGQPLHPQGQWLLAFGSFFLASAGDYEGALGYFKRVDAEQRLAPYLYIEIKFLASMAFMADELGHDDIAARLREKALAAVSVVEDFGATRNPHYTFALAVWHASQRSDDRALAMLEQAVEQGFREILQLRHYVPLQRFQDNARFRELIEKVEAELAIQRARAIENGWIFAAPT